MENLWKTPDKFSTMVIQQIFKVIDKIEKSKKFPFIPFYLKSKNNLKHTTPAQVMIYRLFSAENQEV